VSEDPGVMGNLPRSRPGRRSEKRETAGRKAPAAKGTTARKASGGATRKGRAGASTRASRDTAGRTPSSSRRARPAASRGAATADARAARGDGSTTRSGGDPLTDAVRVAGKLAGAGLGIAAGVLRRLPRP
jgi:hypothetical protein